VVAAGAVQKLKRGKKILEKEKQQTEEKPNVTNKLKLEKLIYKAETKPNVTNKLTIKEDQAGGKNNILASSGTSVSGTPYETTSNQKPALEITVVKKEKPSTSTSANPTTIKKNVKKKGIENARPAWPPCCDAVRDQFEIAVALTKPGFVQFASENNSAVTPTMIVEHPHVLFVTLKDKQELEPSAYTVTTTGAIQRAGNEPTPQNHLPLFVQVRERTHAAESTEWTNDVELLYETCDMIEDCCRINGERFSHVILPSKEQLVQETTGDEQMLVMEAVTELVAKIRTDATGRPSLPMPSNEQNHSWNPEQESNQVTQVHSKDQDTVQEQGPDPTTVQAPYTSEARADPEANEKLGPPYHRKPGSSQFKWRGPCDKVSKRILQERTSVNLVHVGAHGSLASREDLKGLPSDGASGTTLQQQLRAIKIKINKKEVDDHSLTEEEIELWRKTQIEKSAAQVDEQEMEAYNNKQREQERLRLRTRGKQKEQKKTGKPYFQDAGTKEADEETAMMHVMNEPHHWQVRNDKKLKNKELESFYERQRVEREANEIVNAIRVEQYEEAAKIPLKPDKEGMNPKQFEELLATIS